MLEGDPVHAVGAQGAGVELALAADDHLPAGAIDLEHVERRPGSYAQSLSLSDCEILNAAMLADYLARGSNEIAGSIRQSLSLLCQVSVQKLLVVTAGNKTDFLRIRLVGEHEA